MCFFMFVGKLFDYFVRHATQPVLMFNMQAFNFFVGFVVTKQKRYREFCLVEELSEAVPRLIALGWKVCVSAL